MNMKQETILQPVKIKLELSILKGPYKPDERSCLLSLSLEKRFEAFLSHGLPRSFSMGFQNSTIDVTLHEVWAAFNVLFSSNFRNRLQ